MSARITTHHDYIILDACVLMNLYASRQMENILSAITEIFTVATYVMKYEAITVYKKSKYELPQETEPIQLQPLIDKGLIFTVDLESDDERASFISFSTQRLDDGEAATMAIAQHRNWAVATDDHRAIRIFSSHNTDIQIISTPELVKHWDRRQKPEKQVLRQAITDIESRANYLVGRKHPLFQWWEQSKI